MRRIFAEQKEKRAILIAAGSFYGLPFSVKKDDLVIAIDGGMKYCEEKGIKPDFLLGDFDSYPFGEEGALLFSAGPKNLSDGAKGQEQEQYAIFGQSSLTRKEYDSAVIRLPRIKNETDLHAAIQVALEQEVREIHIFGGLGGSRMDHSYAALQSLAYLTASGAEGYLYGEKQVFTALKNGTKTFSKEYKGYFSAFSFTEESKGVTERGFKYLVENISLFSTEPVGVSNEFIGKEAEISVENGILILCYEVLQA